MIYRFLLLAMLLSSSAIFDAVMYPADFLGDDADLSEEVALTWSLEDLKNERGLGAQREEAIQRLQKIFGIRGQNDKSDNHKVPPQFMMELYNTIADSSGITRGKNPYNAKVVRSFIERDTSLAQYYFFNISGLEVNESILEAELHLYRKKMSSNDMHPSIDASPYYLIRVYQVLDERNLDLPSLHRLLSVHSVSAHASGWQVFNVKKAVLSWVSGEPNLGLLVTASNSMDEEVVVEFSRRSDYHRSKQPILVLFDDDDSNKARRAGARIIPRYYTYGKDAERAGEYNEESEKIDLENEYDSERSQRHKRQRGQPEVPLLVDRHEAERYQRPKRIRNPGANFPFGNSEESHSTTTNGGGGIIEESRRVRRSSKQQSRKKSRRIVSSRTKLPDILTSMDIYERAMLREKLGPTGRSGRTAVRAAQEREKRSAVQSYASLRENVTGCARHELYVDFQEIGLSSSVIAPKGYSAYHCKGVCEPPLGQDPTNHATVQSIVHKMGLVQGVDRPCCVPTKLLSTTILFYDDHENVILKVYEDMVADRCGCR